MSVYIVKRANAKRPTTYHVRWSKGKYEPYVYLGSLDTKTRAEARRHKVLDLLAIGIEPTLDMFKHSAPRAVKCLRDVADAWMAAQVQWAPSTRAIRENYVDLTVDYFGEQRDPLRITASDVRKWIADMTAAGRKPGTQRTRLTTLAGILDFAGHPDNPVRDKAVKRLKASVIRRPMPTITQLAAIRAELAPAEQAVFDTLEHTGMRIGEATSLRYSQVDTRQRRLVEVGTKSFQRVIPVLDCQPDWLPVKPQDANPDALVFGGTSKRFSHQLTEASKRAGDFHLNPHMLRHVHASRLLAGGKGGGLETDMGPADMAYRMGHSVEVFLKTYTHRIPPEA